MATGKKKEQFLRALRERRQQREEGKTELGVPALGTVVGS